MKTRIDVDKYFEKKKEILEFVASNHERYGFEAAASLMTSFGFDSVLVSNGGINHLELELLSKFGVLRRDTDVYNKFNDFLRERDFLKGNVVEVGAGRYPRLCEVILEDKPDELVNVTAYDPKLILDTFSGVTLMKKPLQWILI